MRIRKPDMLRPLSATLIHMVFWLVSVIACSGLQAQTNTPWPSLKEVLAKWEKVPVEDAKRAAENGDAQAQHYIAYGYAEGLFGAKDTVAIEWYQRAAKAGYVPSWNNLGVIYRDGKLVPRDYAKALEYFKLAAGKNLAQAQVNLGSLYLKGWGVEKNPLKAKELFEHAANQNHAGAMLELAGLYRCGCENPIPKDRAEALKWLHRALELDRPLAEFHLGCFYDGEGNEPEAVSHYLQAAELGNTDSMVQVYHHYRWGKGVEKNLEKGVQWLVKASEANNPWADAVYGDILQNPPPPLKPNTAKAIELFRRSAEMDWAGGQYYLGLSMMKGRGGEDNEEQGLELIRKAADQNHRDALDALADLYARGVGEPRGPCETPIKIYEKITERFPATEYMNTKFAYDQIILRYKFGLGRERDIFEAARWYCKGATAGSWGFPLDEILKEIPSPPNRGISYSQVEPGRQVQHTALTSKETQEWHSALKLLVEASRPDASKLMQIGKNYRLGKEVPTNQGRAWIWYQLAGQAGSKEAATIAGEIEKLLTSEELTEAKRQLPVYAEELKKIAPFNGLAEL